MARVLSSYDAAYLRSKLRVVQIEQNTKEIKIYLFISKIMPTFAPEFNKLFQNRRDDAETIIIHNLYLRKLYKVHENGNPQRCAFPFYLFFILAIVR